MKSFVKFVLAVVVSLAALSCTDDLIDTIENGMINFGLGDSEMQAVNFGYIDKNVDLSEYISKVSSFKKLVDYTVVPLVAFVDSASIADAAKYLGQFGDGRYGSLDGNYVYNEIDMQKWVTMPAVFQCFPQNAKVDEITVWSSDPEMLRVENGETMVDFNLTPLKVGECKLYVVAKGKNVVRKVYPIRIVATLKMSCYIDQFWGNNHFARVKYKIEQMPHQIQRMHINVQDSVVVIGAAHGIDEWHGMNDYGYKTDTTCFPLRQHTDTYRTGKRILLRNVSVPVDYYNWYAYEVFYIRIGKEEFKNTIETLKSIPFKLTIGSDGSYWLIMFENTPFERRWRYLATNGIWGIAEISRTLYMVGQWPFKPSFVYGRDHEGNGHWYLSYYQPYCTKQVKLFLSVLCDNPYIKFAVNVKQNGMPEDTDGDEPDESLDFRDESGIVVDSLGTTLGQYFWVSFLENMSIHQRDSLARELERITREVKDSTKWVLDWNPDFYNEFGLNDY